MALPGDDDSKEPRSRSSRAMASARQGLPRRLARPRRGLVDKYHPDFLYFDWWIGQPAFQPYLKRFAAYYYDEASPSQGVVLTYKGDDFPENSAVLDIERGKLDALGLLPGETDTSVTSIPGAM